jgi:hypothetical protein
MNADHMIATWGDPRIVLPPLLPLPEVPHQKGRGYGVAKARRRELTNVEAVQMVFRDTLADDFYPICAERWIDGEPRLQSFVPLLHRDRHRHDEVIAMAGDRKTYWNLASYRTTAIRASGSFTWKKEYVRGLHGVFIDFDCGRKPGDEDYDEPGRKLTQEEVWRDVNVLIEQQVLPPFQMWADGTRGCYGVMLFEHLHHVFEAAEVWRDVRSYFFRRAKHLAADEGARAITQPLKAPGGSGGVVRYYSTGIEERTSLPKLLEWFRAHPHETDLSEMATDRYPFTVDQQKRFDAAWSKCDRYAKPRSSSAKKRVMTWQQKAAPTKAMIDDLTAYVNEFGRTGSSRRRFFLDLASAVKLYEYKRDGDSRRAYGVAMQTCEEVNSLLENPLSPWRLKEQVQSADPQKSRSSEQVRFDMEITDAIAERLNLRTLVPPSLRAERIVREREEKARRAEQRALDRERKAAEKEAAKVTRQLECKERKKKMTAPRPKKNADRDGVVEMMLREGKPTSEITETGVHRQQVSRIRARLVAAGEELPEQMVLKRGRKKKVTLTE